MWNLRFQSILILFLVFVSGISGLIYQVVWHRYLGILLGAHAKATALVLAVFLGGIALGYYLFGRWTHRHASNLLRVYAIVEIALAFWGLAFAHLFSVALPLAGWLYRVWGINSLATDAILSILLIGPPTILMGGTLPLLTQAKAQTLSEASRTHSSIYAWNTLGACLGCLLAGYALIPAIGLAGASAIAGVGNAFVSLIAYFALAKSYEPPIILTPEERASAPAITHTQWILLMIAFASGFYVISLETVLIRLMSLTTGASNYNFSLIVAVFILGLGFSSLIARRIDRYRIDRLLWNQAALVAALIALYYSQDYWSYAIHLIRAAIRDNAENFFLYQLLVAAFYTTLLIIPIGLAGFTLPLCFHFMKDDPRTLGHRVGQLYCVSTVGCVLGALIGGYWLFHWFNLDGIFKLCIALALMTVFSSVILLTRRYRWSVIQFVFASAVPLALSVFIAYAPSFDRRAFTQPFRYPAPIEGVSYHGKEAFARHLSRSTEYIFYKDGPNTSVGIGVTKYGDMEHSLSLFVNGKSDGNTRGDRLTTVLLGHIPGLLAKKIERVCVIGFGTGMTIGALSLYGETRQIDVAEISSTILDNRGYFDNYNYAVSTNPKIRLHEMDAFRLLTGSSQTFDVIISEPSNPWVMGIENLYSDEFYKIASEKLSEQGMFVQWIHTYSFTDDLFRVTLRTIAPYFSNISVFQLRGGDLAIVATRRPFDSDSIHRAQERFQQAQVKKDLNDSGIESLFALLSYEILTNSTVRAITRSIQEPYRLEYPRLSDEASRAFFSQASAQVFDLRRQFPEFYRASHSESLLAMYSDQKPKDPNSLASAQHSLCESALSAHPILCAELNAIRAINSNLTTRSKSKLPEATSLLITYLTTKRAGAFTPKDLQDFSLNFDRFKQLYSPIARLTHQPFIAEIDRCLRSVKPTEELFGDCLLQRVVLAQHFVSQSDSHAWISRYLDWYAKLPASHAPRFTQAGNLLRAIATARD